MNKHLTLKKVKNKLIEFAYYFYVGQCGELFTKDTYQKNISDEGLLDDIDLLLKQHPHNEFEIRECKKNFLKIKRLI